jgi:two-component sensor histidine kinase
MKPTRPPADGPESGSPQCAHDCPIRSEADHRIANHLNLLSSYTRLRGAEFDGDGAVSHASVRLLAQSIEAQIRSVARLHTMMTLQAGAISTDLSPLLHEICAPFTGRPEQRVVLVEDLAAGCWVNVAFSLSIGQIAGEAIINAMKHAFPDSSPGVLLVRSRRTATNGVLVEVIDNGPGLPAAFDPDRDGGFGFNLMRSLSRGLRAPLGFVSSPAGLRVSLTLPGAGALADGPADGGGRFPSK